MFSQDYEEQLVEKRYRQGLQLKDDGRLIVGMYCSFTPKELMLAAGVVPVSLCAGSQNPIEAAEEHLPRNICPLIKSSYGFALTKSCRYFEETDLIVADTTCDGKKKMFELLANLRPVHLLKIPQNADEPDQLEYFIKQLEQLKEKLETRTGHVITEDALRKEIIRYNRLRQALRDVYALNREKPALLFGMELNRIASGDGFVWDLEERIAEIEAAKKQVISRSQDPGFLKTISDRPRLLLTGCPTTNRKIIEITEERGGLIAVMENCGSLKTLDRPVDETIDPMRALAEKYLAVACPCMTPNPGRFDLINRIIRDFHIDGVLDMTWEACQLYDVEAFSIGQFVSSQLGVPYLQINTDYSESDHAQLGVRIEAFLEMISG